MMKNVNYEQELSSFELLTNTTITIVDRSGTFHNSEGTHFFTRFRQSHRKLSICDLRFCRTCIEHCRHAINEFGEKQHSPFLHRCWKNVCELVVPLFHDGIHVGSFFVGTWRLERASERAVAKDVPQLRDVQSQRLGTGKNIEKSTLKIDVAKKTSSLSSLFKPIKVQCFEKNLEQKRQLFVERFPDSSLYKTQYEKTYQALPAIDPDFIMRLMPVAENFANGLMEKAWNSSKKIPFQDPRREKIIDCLSKNASKKFTLDDLATILCLSQSRTSHLVKGLFGISFQDLVTKERVNRAKTLISTTDLTLAEIAEQTGFVNEYYFNRVFKKTIGTTPGSFRRKSLSKME